MGLATSIPSRYRFGPHLLMKKLIALLPILFWCAGVQAQNIEGQIIASQYGKWRVPGYAANTYSHSRRPRAGCREAPASSSPLPWARRLRSSTATLAQSETVTPTSTVDSDVTCAVSIAPVNSHQLPFYITSGTGGLQEALNENLTNPQTNTIILDNAFYQLVGGAPTPAAIIAAAQGGTNLGLVDVTQVPTVWYQWNGSHYAKVSIIGSAGNLNTLVNDLVSNNSNNTAAQDLYDFVATGPTDLHAAGGGQCRSGQQWLGHHAAWSGTHALYQHGQLSRPG